jgi:hypothetical protein
MVPMSWTQAELDALKAAYASGTLRVSYDGKTVEYASADDLKKRIQTIEGAIDAAGGNPRPIAGFASFGRGDR